MEGDLRERYNRFKQLHDEAFKLLDDGLKLEQRNQFEEAVVLYERGVVTVDRALRIYIESDSDPELWDKYFEQVVKMKNARKEVESRLASLRAGPPPAGAAPPNGASVMMPSNPPSYEEATSPYASLTGALEQLRADTVASAADSEVVFRQEGVHMYFIAPDGQVSSLSQPLTLTIARAQGENELAPTFYLQLGSWVYPLVPGISPVLRAESGTFIIPDLQATVPGSAVGLVVADGEDSGVLDVLSDILRGIQPAAPAGEEQERLSQRISHGLVSGAQFVSAGVVRGAEWAGSLLNRGTPALIERMQPAAEQTPVPPRLSKGLRVARDVTSVAVTFTTFVANKVGTATMSLGRFLAPHVQAQGTRLLTSVSGLSENEASTKVEGALEVTAGAVTSFTTVYAALEDAAAILGRNLANNTVQIVQHKYGQQAGVVTEDTLAAVGNAVVVGHTARGLTVKGIAKRTAKNAGKALVEDYQPKQGPDGEKSDPGDKELPGPSKEPSN
ncbi:protein spartin isoform X2 [Cloeon dipterum]|uniref:protein spartin isoform X2 n=1 Tax=Cloeon dipterum TaxID=197152 RepID=UPI00321F77E4